MYSVEHSAAEVAIAERRGAWVTVVLSGPDGFEASCTTDATAPWFRTGSFGSVGKPGNAAALPGRGIAATQLGTGSIADKPLSIATQLFAHIVLVGIPIALVAARYLRPRTA